MIIKMRTTAWEEVTGSDTVKPDYASNFPRR